MLKIKRESATRVQRYPLQEGRGEQARYFVRDKGANRRAMKEISIPIGTKFPTYSGFQAVFKSLFARGLIIAVNASTGIITARMLNPQGRGEVSAMTIWAVFVTFAMSLGLPSSLTYHISNRTSSSSGLVGAALLMSLVANTVSGLIASLFLPQILHFYSAQTIFYARLFLIGVPLGVILQVGRAAFEARGEFSLSMRAQWLVPLATLLSLGALVSIHGFTPVLAASIYVFGGLPVALWMLWRLWLEFHPSLEHLTSTSKSLLSYGIRSYGIDLCGTLSVYVDQALVVSLLNAQQMGAYVVALSMSRMLNVFQSSVVMVLFPKAVGRPAPEILEVTGTAARLSTLLTAIVGGVLALLGPVALRLLYGSKYLNAVPIFRILMLEVIINGLVMVLAQAPMALGKPGVVTMLQSVGLTLTIPLMMVLVPRYGLFGAGYALLLATTCRLLLVAFSFSWFLKLHCPRLYLTVSDCRIAFTKVITVVPVLNKFALTMPIDCVD